jgi:hypothetical protein
MEIGKLGRECTSTLRERDDSGEKYSTVAGAAQEILQSLDELVRG